MSKLKSLHGVKVKHFKNTEDCSTEILPIPDRVVIDLWYDSCSPLFHSSFPPEHTLMKHPINRLIRPVISPISRRKYYAHALCPHQ